MAHASNNNDCSNAGPASSAVVLYKKSDYDSPEVDSTTSDGHLLIDISDQSTTPADQQPVPQKKQKTSPPSGTTIGGSRPSTAMDELTSLASALAMTDITGDTQDKEDKNKEDDLFEDAKMEVSPSESMMSFGAVNSYDMMGQFADDEAEE